MNDQELCHYLLSSYLDFTRHFFKAKTGREFVCTPPIGRRSHYEIIAEELEDVFSLKCKRLILNLPPGHAKSTMLIYFVAWSLAHYPDSNFIYISYSSTLAEKHTATIKEIIEMPLYRHLFGVELRKDSQAKGNFKTTVGGSVMAFGSSGSITGCFDYDAKVLTEMGEVSIGYLVENKVNARVVSLDMGNNKYELKSISGWYENPANTIVKVYFNDGESIECTPDHKILTNNRGWVEAKDLSQGDVLNSIVASDKPGVGDAVPIISIKNISPLNIEIVRHVNKTYCLEVEDNHNFILKTGNRSIIVSNCDAGLPNLDRFSGGVILDDVHKPDEVFSDTIRGGVIENYNQTIKPRPRGPNVPIVFIGQRLHEDDLGAFLINNKDGYQWKKVILKAIDEAGNALCPQINSLEMLEIEQEHNPYVFSSQYQQDPQPAGGGIFKPDWFVQLDQNPQIIHTFITCDTAETSKDYNDATAFSFWGVYKIQIRGVDTGMYGLHWLDCRELHIEPKDLESEFFDFYSACMRFYVKPKFVAIEKKSTGVTLLSILKDAQGLRVIDIERTRASGNKTSRFLEIQPFVSRRQISLPTYGKHTSLCIEHCRKITANDTHRRDDLADTLYDAVKLALIDNMLLPKDSGEGDSIVSEMANRLNTIQALKQNRRW